MITFDLIYQAKKDGFSGKIFHALCNDKGPTVTLIKNEYNYVFGGFTSLSWSSPEQSEWKRDKSAFVFSLTHETKHSQY